MSMQPSLLTNKLYFPPTRPAIVHRPRLVDQVQAGLNGRFTLISAPAGSGKTTLLSEWHAGPGAATPVAWVSLDAADNDPLRFFQYLFAALDSLQPGIVLEIQPYLQASEKPNIENILTLLVNSLGRIAQDFVLVLDDYHVIRTPAIHEALAFLLDNLPPYMHLVLLTRTDPSLPLARLRARTQLTEVRAADLRFSVNEVAEFLNQVMHLGLTHEQISALEGRTEGWIAGLQLVALSMQRCTDIQAFVAAFTGSHHYVMDYLLEEVLKLQPKNVSDFLLQTSILDRMSGSLCEAVIQAGSTGPLDGQAMLETLDQMNLFVIPLDDDRHWYRYHHLFADVLRKRLEHQSPHLLTELHGRASKWYEQNGFIAESIQQAIAAGNHDRAAQLIEENGCFLLISGEVATLLSWTDAIEFQSETRPWLAIQKAWALALSGNLDLIEPTLQAPERLLSTLEPSIEVRTLLGTIAAARAFCANSRGNTQLAAKYAQQALELLPDCSSISQSIRSVATSILGDASWINGNMDEALLAYTEAIRIGRAANNLHMVIIDSTNTADIFMEQGQLHRAADTYTQSLQMAIRPDGQRSPLAGPIYDGLTRLSYERNLLNDADQYVHLGIDLSRQWGDVELEALAYAMLARIEHVRNHLESAREVLRRAEQLGNEHSLSPRRSIQLKSELAYLWLAHGNHEKLAQFIQKSKISIDDEIKYQRMPEYIILARVLLAQGDYKTALVLSERLLRLAKTAGRISQVIELQILQALAFQAMKDTDRALVALERALLLAQPEGFVRIFLDESEAMTRLLCLVKSRQAGAVYANELLAMVDKISDMTKPSMRLLIEPLTRRELEVFRLIEAGCSNLEISEQLVLSIATVKRHISNIYGKLGVKSRTQAIAMGKELGLFE